MDWIFSKKCKLITKLLWMIALITMIAMSINRIIIDLRMNDLHRELRQNNEEFKEVINRLNTEFSR